MFLKIREANLTIPILLMSRPKIKLSAFEKDNLRIIKNDLRECFVLLLKAHNFLKLTSFLIRCVSFVFELRTLVIVVEK